MIVMDFNNGRLRHFDLKFLKTDEADEELKGYMRSIWKSHVENIRFG
ncbi:hypothetical protein H1D32_13465 [Anaerobacillus sp. CMMVII]|nr:hypothetical protein [Anaerobacillus sp. CMMVII]MCT8138663.1 hypothetical protein [Anaerobacillus sp. CMMVII]